MPIFPRFHNVVQKLMTHWGSLERHWIKWSTDFLFQKRAGKESIANTVVKENNTNEQKPEKIEAMRYWWNTSPQLTSLYSKRKLVVFIRWYEVHVSRTKDDWRYHHQSHPKFFWLHKTLMRVMWGNRKFNRGRSWNKSTSWIMRSVQPLFQFNL